MAQKTLNTRILLKYDTWTNWSNDTVANQGANLVLKKGEVAFCEVPSGASVDGVQNPPHILYKVGDGTKKFSELAWGSAKASDVHTWAKESQAQFENRVSGLISAALNGEGQATIKGYVTESDFNEFKTTIENRVKDVEDRVKAIEDDYTDSAKLAKAVSDAKAELIGHDYDAATADTIYGAKKAAAAADKKASDNATEINTIKTTISQLDNTYATDEALRLAKEDLQGKIDLKVAQSDYNTKVAALEKADTDLAARVTPLETDVNALKTASATHATKTELEQAVAGLKSNGADTKDSETIAGAKKYTDQAIADFTAAYITDDGGTIDKLQEIAAWIADDEAGAAKVAADVAKLQSDKLDKTEFNQFKTGEFKTVADKAHTHAADAVDINAEQVNTWDVAAGKAHTHVSGAIDVVTADKEKWDKVTEKANQSDLNSHTTNKNNPHEVTAAQVGAYTKEEADGKFVKPTDTIASAAHANTANSASNADYATRANQDAAGNVITDTYETKTNVNALQTRVKAIEDDYLKEADEFIIDCGSSSKNIF